MKLLVNIGVDNIEKALKFYTAALGLRPGRRLGNRFAELTGASARIYLLQERKGSRAVPGLPRTRNYRRHGRPCISFRSLRPRVLLHSIYGPRL